MQRAAGLDFAPFFSFFFFSFSSSLYWKILDRLLSWKRMHKRERQTTAEVDVQFTTADR